MPILPNAERAVADIEKLRDYALNPEHDEGQHKARVFLSALGFTQDDAATYHLASPAGAGAGRSASFALLGLRA